MESAIVYDIWTIVQVILVDLALGGDNSIVIGMAAKNLPHDLQKKAILYGTAGAIFMRVLMAAMVIWLLQIPYLKTVGAVLLIAIGIKLIGANDDDEVNVEAKDSLFDAIRTIIAADALMSLDNVLGIVGTTGGNLELLVLGMLISVPIIIFGSTIVIKIMNRFPILVYIGGIILGWAAGGMITTDQQMAFLHPYGTIVKGSLVVITIIGGFLWRHVKTKKSS